MGSKSLYVQAKQIPGLIGDYNRENRVSYGVKGQVERYSLLPDPETVSPDDYFIVTQTEGGNNPGIYRVEGGVWVIASSSAETSVGVYHSKYVAENGDDVIGDGTITRPYRTIEKALESITDNGPTSRYVIILAPGIYTENTLQMKSYVVIKSNGGSQVTRISAADPTQNLILSAPVSSVIDVSFAGLTTGYAVAASSAGAILLRGVNFINCQNGVLCSDEDAEVVMWEGSVVAGSAVNRVARVTAGRIRVNGFDVIENPLVANLFEATGSLSRLEIINLFTRASNVATAVRIENLATLTMETSLIENATDAIYLSGGSDSKIDLVNIRNSSNDGIVIPDLGSQTKLSFMGSSVENSGRYDVNIESPTALLVGIAKATVETSFINPLATANVLVLDLFPGDEAFRFVDELHVGSPARPKESVFGEGDSHTRLRAFTYDGVTFEEVTVEAKSAMGSTFTFPGITAGNMIYLTNEYARAGVGYLPFYGIKAVIDTAAVLGAGSFVVEYWNGVSWESVNFSVREASGNFFPYAEQLFERTGDFQIRFDGNLATDSWVKNDPPGLLDADRYWIRFRIVSDITTAPVFEQWKIHSSRFEINADGFTEYMGVGRPWGNLPWSETNLAAGSTNPSDGDTYYSDRLDIGKKETLLSTGHRVGFDSVLPEDMDTSTPVRFRVAIRLDSTGDFNYQIVNTYAEPGSAVYGSAVGAPPIHPNAAVITGSVSGNADEIVWIEEMLNFSKAIARRDGGFPDLVACSIESLSGSEPTAIVKVHAAYLRWDHGGHI